jgi:hypothetical protein
MTFIYNVNGVNTEFSTDDLMNLPEGDFCVIEKIITEGYVPLHDFTMMKAVPTIKKSFSSSKITAICNV